MDRAQCLKFDEIKIGDKKEFEVAITPKLIDKFAELSGDFSPLHMDKKFAEKTKFGKRVAHGFLAASFLSQLVGMHLPGERALYLSQTLKFRAPIFENDLLKISGEVIGKSEALKLLTIKTAIAKSTGKTVLEGEAKVSYLEG